MCPQNRHRCQQCNKLLSPTQKFCNITCQTRFEQRTEKFCVICNKSLGRIHTNKKTCSNTCRGLLRRREAREIRICGVCKSSFETYKKTKKLYCSDACRRVINALPETNAKRQHTIQSTNMQRYGVPYTSQTDTWKRNVSQKMIDRYADLDVKQTMVDKIKDTKRRRYGNPNYNNLKKATQTLLDRYNVTNWNETTSFKRTFFDKAMKRIAPFVRPMFSFEEYMGVDHQYTFQCVTCNHIFTDTANNARIPRCKQCFPNRSGSSQYEDELCAFITTHYTDPIERNTRTIIAPKELDVYVPDRRLAIEFNGLYWHSEIGGGKDKHYHMQKLQLCRAKGIQLLQIGELDWIYKRPIVESVILYALGQSRNIYARACTIRPLSAKTCNQFLNENHLQGGDKSSIRYGLYHHETLVAVMTFGKSRYDKLYEYELLRFCNIQGHRVVGGFSKLFTHFKRSHQPTSVVSYANKMYYSGQSYQSAGFIYAGDTPPGYQYIDAQYTHTMSRLLYQKHKLPTILDKYDMTLTEWENMQLNGYDRIWDCGNTKWIWSH